MSESERRNQWKPLAVAVAVAGTLFGSLALAWNEARQHAHEQGRDDRRIGMEAPAVNLTRLDGSGDVSLESHRGRVVMLDFWATTCPPCRREMPHIERLRETLPAEEFALISVNVDEATPEREAIVREWLASEGLELPVVLDFGEVTEAYEVRRIPLIVLVDREGFIRRVFRGWREPEVLERAVREELARGV